MHGTDGKRDWERRLGRVASMACLLIAASCLCLTQTIINSTSKQAKGATVAIASDDMSQGIVTDATNGTLTDMPDGTKKTFKRADYRKSKSMSVARKLITKGMLRMSKSIDISKARLSQKLVTDVYHGILDEDPRMWYVGGTGEYVPGKDGIVLEVRPTYLTDDPKVVSSMQSKYEKAMDTILNAVPSQADTIMKIRIVHDRIIRGCSYNTVCRDDPDSYKVTLTDNPYGAYSAIVQDKTVCRGYSLAFKDACQRLGIECDVTRTLYHEWNKVRVGESWFNVDLTFDDGDDTDENRYVLFLKSDSYLDRYDKENLSVRLHHGTLPVGTECTDTRYDNPSALVTHMLNG